MKKTLLVFTATLLVFVLSACNSFIGGLSGRKDHSAGKKDSDATLLSRDRAIELALDEAGVERNEVRDLEAELDRERGGIYWEVDFEAGKVEFSYDIHAKTGEITKAQREFD